MNPLRCDTCRFYHHRIASDDECRLHPPSLLMKNNGTPLTRWPSVESDDWCGQWLERPHGIPAPQST